MHRNVQWWWTWPPSLWPALSAPPQLACRRLRTPWLQPRHQVSGGISSSTEPCCWGRNLHGGQITRSGKTLALRHEFLTSMALQQSIGVQLGLMARKTLDSNNWLIKLYLNQLCSFLGQKKTKRTPMEIPRTEYGVVSTLCVLLFIS